MFCAKTKKRIIKPAFFVLWVMSMSSWSYGQNNFILGQYFQMMQSYAPGLTGANEYLDVRIGSRQQWIGNENSPTTFYMSASTTLTMSETNPHQYNSIRVSDMSPYTRKPIKLGIGLFVVDNSTGPYNRRRVMANTAVHVLIDRDTYVSLGVSSGYSGVNVDIGQLRVLYPDNDTEYQNYLNTGARASFLETSSGLSIYSSRYYLSYSIIGLVRSFVAGNEDMADSAVGYTHNILGGYRFHLNQDFEITPNMFYRYSNSGPNTLDVGARMSYRQSLMVGLSYRNDQSVISMFSFFLMIPTLLVIHMNSRQLKAKTGT